jgi:hypothetical protein
MITLGCNDDVMPFTSNRSRDLFGHKTARFVRTITEWLFCALAAAAQGYFRFSLKVKCLAVLVCKLKLTFNSDGAVGNQRNFSWHCDSSKNGLSAMITCF